MGQYIERRRRRRGRTVDHVSDQAKDEANHHEGEPRLPFVAQEAHREHEDQSGNVDRDAEKLDLRTRVLAVERLDEGGSKELQMGRKTALARGCQIQEG